MRILLNGGHTRDFDATSEVHTRFGQKVFGHTRLRIVAISPEYPAGRQSSKASTKPPAAHQTALKKSAYPLTTPSAAAPDKGISNFASIFVRDRYPAPLSGSRQCLFHADRKTG
jgi:hypothetical protein